jgi:hypothetical protein
MWEPLSLGLPFFGVELKLYLLKTLSYIFHVWYSFQVLLEQVTSSPWNNILFLFYYGYVVESKCVT